MGDISNWKNKNRKFLKEPVFLPKKLTKKIGEVDIEKETKKFLKESVWINKLKNKGKK
jgi:hypothetical protein